jgi:hypothetical protein
MKFTKTLGELTDCLRSSEKATETWLKALGASLLTPDQEDAAH